MAAAAIECRSRSGRCVWRGKPEGLAVAVVLNRHGQPVPVCRYCKDYRDAWWYDGLPVVPEELPDELLRLQMRLEREHQQALRKRIAALTLELRASEERGRAVQGQLARQPVLMGGGE